MTPSLEGVVMDVLERQYHETHTEYLRRFK
jgi:hypothetical protein